ncbi:hypothetical protein ACF1AJ_07675 [Leifsonia sp. NPDC014704]|uniref:hypothetical protein n=1 Tax=Leifsonia sp. NPDC014704 TaxID=3364123 RepID=UPI0036F4934B
MAGDRLGRPWFVLTTNRGGSWFFAIFYTSFAAFEVYEAMTHGLGWQWLLAAGFSLLSVLGWASLVWVFRHPQPSSTGERDDG